MGDTASDTQDTSSSTTFEDGLNLSFEDLTYSVRNGIFTKGRKTIVSQVSGSFRAGELSVIVGQSGAGKSTLMDLLAGFSQPTSGTVLVNGKVRDGDKFRRRCCYILQDSMTLETLTAQESLFFAADLKLGNHVSKKQKHQRVEELLTSLGLRQARDTLAGALSGGQKKRLSIGLELVSDPSVMFLDEPISGLDTSISKQIVYLLHVLARQGRTVVVTMHTPSAALLQLVDRLYAMVAGKCIYMGTVAALIPHLEQIDLQCPPYHNPVDFLIEVSATHYSELLTFSMNGRSSHSITGISQEKTDNNLIEQFKLSTADDVFLTTLPSPKENPTNKILLALKTTYSTSFWKQFTTLTWRALLTLWRNPFFTLMITGIHCCVALFIGVLFYNIGEDGSYVRDNFNYLYFSLMFLMFTAFSSVYVKFPEQIPLVRREHFNRWYSSGSYYAATLVSALPTQTVCTLVYACVTYWLTGQPRELIRFMVFCETLIMVSYVALVIGLLNGAMFNIKHGAVCGPFIVMPFTIFSGFFLQLKDAPYIFRWVFHISFLKHGLVGLVHSIYGLHRPKLPCSSLFCYFSYPSQFIDSIGMAHEQYSVVIFSLIGISLAIIVSTFIILKIRLKYKW